jgi:hypothetical protein
MMNKNIVITKLLDLWYQCIGPAHHKSRDCRFTISTNYCTYQDIDYTVEHHGYILHRLPTFTTFKTLGEAENYLVTLLTYGILRETDHAMDDSDEVFSDLGGEKAEEIKMNLCNILIENGLEKHLDFAREMGENLI